MNELIFLTLLTLDYGQTRDIAHACDGRINCTIHETNPILGAHPSNGAINRYFLTAAVAHAIITEVLPPDYRQPWLVATSALEVAVIGNNKRIGLHLRF